MPTSSEPAERAALPRFLAEHTPFQAATDDELTALAEGAAIETFPADVVVADYASRVPDAVWMVRDGLVALRASGDGVLIDIVGPGGIFGYLPLLSGAGMDFRATTSAPSTLIRLPGGLVQEQFAKPTGLAFLAASGWNRGAERATIAPATDARPVSELVHGEVLLVAPQETVRDVVIKMTEHHVSYALIRLPGDSGEPGLGIFTDRDLRTRVVAAGRSVDAPIASVMSAPIRTVTADLTADSVLMEMLECGLRHIPVLTPRGEVLGVLEDADLLAASARQSFLLRRSIAQAHDAAALRDVGRQVTGTAVDLFRNGTKAVATSAILSVVVDSLVRRALEIVVAQADSPPPDGFAWLTLGSVARREAMPSSDVDSAVSWRDDLGAHSDRFRHIAAEVHQLLAQAGLPTDRNGATADKTKFSRSRSEWRTAAQGWLAEPLQGRGLMFSSLLIDGRVVWGDPGLHTVPSAYHRIREQYPEALRLQLLDALSARMRTRSLRDVLSRRGGTFDLKNHAVTPIVNLARWGGLVAGVTSASTPTRLAAAAQAGALTERDAGTLTEVFTMLQRMRMAHQVQQITAGRPPGDIVASSELSPLDRSQLGDGLREIAAVRRRVGTVGLSGQ
ncbi:CBS domain-containing protein [Mycolicibacterium sp. 3033]|nr:CBS domain-containing protein [Mycolicibacterium aurantiacum]